VRQETSTEEKNLGIRFKGFVKSDYWYDSRQVIASREDLFLLYPAPKKFDTFGEDINAQPIFNFSAITSRLTGMISGPDAFGAKTSGVIEADFSGVSNADINGFRLRHAYGKLRWKKSELLFGQFWHPMYVTDVFPNVISLNTGAPFQPFIRNPQLSYKYFFSNFNLNLVLIAQRDNSSDGPDGFSPAYMRNSLVPNAHIQLQHKSEHHIYGLAADYKVLQPRLETSTGFKTNSTISTYALMLYYKYLNKAFQWSAKTIYGQNLTEHLMMGGYAIRSIDSAGMKETYTPTNHLYAWSFISYGKKVQLRLFGGFIKNFGTTHSNSGIYFGRGSNIDYLYRISPSISFISNSVQIATELEYTAAAYGIPDNMGKVRNAEKVGNLRLLLTFFYFF